MGNPFSKATEDPGNECPKSSSSTPNGSSPRADSCAPTVLAVGTRCARRLVEVSALRATMPAVCVRLVAGPEDVNGRTMPARPVDKARCLEGQNEFRKADARFARGGSRHHRASIAHGVSAMPSALETDCRAPIRLPALTV